MNFCRGSTLVETVTALALVATLAASVLTIQHRLLRARQDAVVRVDAATYADELLRDWFGRGELPRNAQGTIASNSSWRWRTVRVEQVAIGTERFDRMALEVWREGTHGPGESPSCRIEVIVAADEGAGDGAGRTHWMQ